MPPDNSGGCHQIYMTLRSALRFFLWQGGANPSPCPITEQMLITAALKRNSNRTLKMHTRRTSRSWNGFGEKGNPAVTSTMGGGLIGTGVVPTTGTQANPSLTCRPADYFLYCFMFYLLPHGVITVHKTFISRVTRGTLPDNENENNNI